MLRLVTLGVAFPAAGDSISPPHGDRLTQPNVVMRSSPRMKFSISICLAAVLTVLCWVGGSLPARAQSSISAPVLSVVSGGTPLLSFSGKRPTDLGVKDGRLAACPASPNCVSSQAPSSDPEHSIAPLTIRSSPEQAIAHLKSVIQGLERSTLVQDQENYLYAEFKSALMGFVDDVEFYLDPSSSVIHVRSASRLGQSDLGVNRKRVEEIRARFNRLEGNG